ncbi:MAG TPA: MmcQ/YjbR family DNA-binding protein [Rhizomicrobium sp.]
MPNRRTPPKYAFLKRVALGLPGAVEVQDRHGRWFNIGKKTFALYEDTSERWILRLPHAQVTMLTEASPGIFAPMRNGALLWLHVDVAKLGPRDLRAYVTAAWRYTAPKKLAAQLDAR